MLLSAEYLTNYKIEANDGAIGKVDSFLFDDREWIIRYLVADTGHWLAGRKVLLAPSVLGQPEGTNRILPVDLSRQQVQNSPDIDTERTVSRQQEIELHQYYQWEPYWGGSGVFGPIPMQYVPAVPSGEERTGQEERPEEPEIHLRSTREVMGYSIAANDGRIGHISDFIIHSEDWRIRYMVADTARLLHGRKVLLPVDWIKEFRWAESEAVVDVTREMIRESPEFEPAAPVNREYEVRLYDYYGRPKYWL